MHVCIIWTCMTGPMFLHAVLRNRLKLQRCAHVQRHHNYGARAENICLPIVIYERCHFKWQEDDILPSLLSFLYRPRTERCYMSSITQLEMCIVKVNKVWKEMEFYLWTFVQMFLDCLIILCHIYRHGNIFFSSINTFYQSRETILKSHFLGIHFWTLCIWKQLDNIVIS